MFNSVPSPFLLFSSFLRHTHTTNENKNMKVSISYYILTIAVCLYLYHLPITYLLKPLHFPTLFFIFTLDGVSTFFIAWDVNIYCARDFLLLFFPMGVIYIQKSCQTLSTTSTTICSLFTFEKRFLVTEIVFKPTFFFFIFIFCVSKCLC